MNGKDWMGIAITLAVVVAGVVVAYKWVLPKMGGSSAS